VCPVEVHLISLLTCCNSKPQRDWRNDDGNPNKCVLSKVPLTALLTYCFSWSRRESQGSERAPLPSPSARKHPRSPTRSRSGSRSPAESYYSRRSSRARTRSPSASPASKRRRRESSPIAVTGRPSHEGGHAVWVPRQGQPLPSASENTHKQNNLPVRRRNASPTSSMSTGRSPSRSRSPIPELSPSFHRLSTAVSAPAIISSPRTAVDGVSGDARRNGNDAVNGAHNQVGTSMTFRRSN
jgi:CTD kinase subunit alpha